MNLGSTKQVSSDGIDWEESLKLQSSGLVELPKRRQSQNPQPDPLPCPRCDSKNTKFCYYNNYNKLQPRHFCKACKRHWTKGGTLRNVPVGGGRKNKRLKTTAMSSAGSIATGNDQNIAASLGDQKDIFGILSRGPFGTRGNSVNSNFFDNNTSDFPLFQNQVPPFTLSSLGPLEIDNTTPLNCDNTRVGLPSLEDTITIMPSTMWQGPMTSMDVPSDWNWDDVGPLVSPDQLNIDWGFSNSSHDHIKL